jgi:hypothetical protein
MSDPENTHLATPSDPILAGFGPPFLIDSAALAACITADDFTSLSFELYKEVGVVATVSASCYIGMPGDPHVMPRNQAICAGLLIRIAKFMTAIVVLTATKESREVAMALMRCIMDTAVTIRFLILKNDNSIYDEFVRRGLSPEGELFDLVQRNLAARGGESLPVERRLLKTINDLLTASGLTIADIPRQHRDWGGGLRKRLIALGIEDTYAGSQRMPSHAIHGTWVDLLIHHLEQTEAGWRLRPDFSRIDTRLLFPQSLTVLQAASDYLKGFFSAHLKEIEPAFQRFDDLARRIAVVDRAYEIWIQSSREL